MDGKRLERIARAQKGLFTTPQARDCGFSPWQIRHRVQAGHWRRVLGRVLAAASLRLTPDQRARAAPLAIDGGVLSGPSAAQAWGMDAPASATCVTVARRVTQTLPGVRIIRARLDRADVDMLDGVAVTSRARTVFDCLWLLPQTQALEFLERALQRRWITMDGLAAMLHDFAGRHGVTRTVELVKTVSAGTRSAAERLAARLLRQAGIAGWAANVVIRDTNGIVAVGDLVFDDVRLVVELDGWAFHVTPDRFQQDRQRQNRLIANGWTVLRFTWRDLTQRPSYFLATIQATLARLRAASR